MPTLVPTGHPDWLPLAARLVANTLYSGSLTIPANGSVAQFYPKADAGDVVVVQFTGGPVDLLAYSSATGVRVGTVRLSNPSSGDFEWAPIRVLDGGLSLSIVNGGGAPINGILTVVGYFNATLADFRLQPVNNQVSTLAIAAGATVSVAKVVSSGLFDRIAGVAVADQDWGLTLRHSAVGIDGAGTIKTFDIAQTGGTANTPSVWDDLIRGPGVQVLMQNFGAVAMTAWVVYHLSSTGKFA